VCLGPFGCLEPWEADEVEGEDEEEDGEGVKGVACGAGFDLRFGVAPALLLEALFDESLRYSLVLGALGPP